MPRHPKVIKTVRVESIPLDPETYKQVDDLFIRYSKCKDELYRRFSGIDWMLDAQDFKKLRDIVRAEQNSLKLVSLEDRHFQKTLEKKYGLQGRHWVSALKEVSANIRSRWSNLANAIKVRLRDNENLNDAERGYLFHVLSQKKLWYHVLHWEDFGKDATSRTEELLDSVLPERLYYLHNLLRRQTRKNMPGIPQSSGKARCMLLDEVMYKLRPADDAGQSVLSFTSRIPRKQISVRLKSRYCYNTTGDVQLVFDRAKKVVRIHKAILARTSKVSDKKGKPVGIDKGAATLLSCSSEKEYGENFGNLLGAEAERINARNTGRNIYIQRKKDIDARIHELDFLIKAESSRSKAKIDLIREKKPLERMSDNLERNNTGTLTYSREHAKAKAAMETMINHSIREMLATEQPSQVFLEDLSFSRSKGKKFSKKHNRKLSSWLNGTLDNRLEWLCECFDVEVTHVNAAYTSQFCPCCGAKLLKRSGIHNEVSHCPNCGEGNANINAAKVILARGQDPEINRYTPYKKVKQIMETRYAKRWHRELEDLEGYSQK